ncbi:hypothetical protein GOP47_0019227 [Adiantum capillus-veneris]|uniref:Uncharacterized protein n=1 Tax=Adiantum capillus-veneris TaxID=13818 RepID=A0A9D4UFM8_ADICA|nr:hypothetical protein GOP47_0018491 [Adiantum capillus-veneris]KAI5066603.1 hypothetical protein GOP47_0019227 [Adiantum capillus-veneris]
MNCISVLVLIKTGFSEIYGPTTGLLSSQFNPVYIDIGRHCRALRGLRLYMDPLRHSEGWPFLAHPNNYMYEQSTSSALSDLVAATKAEEFELAKNAINYMECLQDDKRPLLEAVKNIHISSFAWLFHLPSTYWTMELVHHKIHNAFLQRWLQLLQAKI